MTTTFRISIVFYGEGGDRERELTSPIAREERGVHPFTMSNPFTSKTLRGFAAMHDAARVSVHWEEGEAFDALLNPFNHRDDILWISDDGVAWEE